MIHKRKRVMKVPLKGDVSSLIEMIREHKDATNGALKFYRNRIRAAATVAVSDPRWRRMTNQLNRLIERKVTNDTTLIGKSSKHLTAMSSFKRPINEFTKRKGNRKRPPRFRRMDLRLEQNEVRVDLDAYNPNVLIGFRKEVGRGVVLHPFDIRGSQRYFDKFKHMDQTVAYLSYKKGRVWISLVFSEEVTCVTPQTFLGLDAGMYSNQNVWYPSLVDRDGVLMDNVALSPVPSDADVDPAMATRPLIELAKENNAAIVTEKLKTLF